MPQSERQARFYQCRDTMIRSAAREGYTIQEIAVALNESERLIRRVTGLIRDVNKQQDSP